MGSAVQYLEKYPHRHLQIYSVLYFMMRIYGVVATKVVNVCSDWVKVPKPNSGIKISGIVHRTDGEMLQYTRCITREWQW